MWGNSYTSCLLLVITFFSLLVKGKVGQTSKALEILWPWLKAAKEERVSWDYFLRSCSLQITINKGIDLDPDFSLQISCRFCFSGFQGSWCGCYFEIERRKLFTNSWFSDVFRGIGMKNWVKFMLDTCKFFFSKIKLFLKQRQKLKLNCVECILNKLRKSP